VKLAPSRSRAAVHAGPRGVPFEFLDTQPIIASTIILDIDGTITPDAKSEISPGVLGAIQSLANRNKVYLFSNHQNGVRNRALAQRLGLEYIDTPHRKPSRKVLGGMPMCHKTRPMIIIGDKILTDGLFASRIGARFIRVARVLSSSDPKLVRLAYFLDNMIAYLLTKLREISHRDDSLEVT